MTILTVLNKYNTIDYDMIANGTIFMIVKSEAGNYSIRQSFRNSEGEYQGATIVKHCGKDLKIAELELDEIIKNFR